MQLAPNVRVIQPTITQNNTMDILKQELPKRVCAYCRVSTDSEEQKTSYIAQKTYYTDKIQSHPKWIFAGIYADEGISGTSMKKRDEFNRMIKDALDGKIDIILCKSIPRFARNVVDILNIIEQLNQKGVPIIFENENINSLDDRQGTRIQILMCAANAEDYSKSLSESVKWGKIRQIEQGNYPFAECFGYNLEIIKNKGGRTIERKITINERQADVIKYIFKTYLDGYSYRQIAKMLEERGICSPKGMPTWKSSTVEIILKNEKYKGDLHLNKITYTDLKFKKRVPNTTGKQYYIEDHHKAIISKTEWNRVAKEIEYRKNQRGYGETGRSVYSSKYPFSNKIYCLQCGSKFRRHCYILGKETIGTWVCINHKKNKANCNQKLFKEKDIEQAFLESLNELIVDKANVIETVISNLEEVIKKRKDDITPEQIDRQIELKQRDLMALIQGISTMDTYKESQQIMNEIENLKTQKTDAILLEKQRSRDLYRTEDLRKLLNKEQQFTEFQPHIFKQLIDKILIDGNKATFVFTNMVKITKILP